MFENQRYPFSLQNGRATIPVNIDLAALALPQGEISIRFDLVDEENLYWFNDHPECVVDAAELRWQPTELSTPSSNVTITSNLPDVIYQKKLSGTVQVHFDNPVLYHDQVKLSWHLYAEDGTELLFENQRLPLTYADGVATALVEIDLGTVEPVSSAKNFVLRFDLVDERDAFWFSQSDSVTLEGGQVTYQYNFIRELRAVFHNVLTKQTFLFVLNLIVDATVITGAIYWWKRRKTAKPNTPPPTTHRSESGAPSVLGEKRREWGYLLVAALLGACVFVLIYGWKVLNPFYVDWLVVYGGDTAQHYVGWELFRNSGWQFPFGMTDAVMYPFQTSIVFTDSIPILAVIFKLLLHSIQAPFQYFGWWGIVCFMLQAGIAASILKKYTGKVFACIASLLFVLAPIMLLRMYAHTALAGQWLILLSVYTIVYYDEKYCDMKRAARRFALIGALTVAVHIYLTAICGVLVCGFALLCWLKQRRVKDIFICLGSYIIPAAVTFYLLGGFFLMGTGDGEALFGLGFYSLNLNAFWNPFGWSSLLPAAPTYTEGQYEGCAYLGVGVLFALVCAVVISAILWAKKHKNHNKNDKRDFLNAALVTATVLVVVSLSNSISFNETILLHYPLPSFLVKIISIFRCTGRFIWPVVYAFMIWALCMLYRQKKLGFVLLGITLVLQVVDLSPRLADKHIQFAKAPAANVTMQSDIWDKLADSGQYRHIAFVSKIADFEAVNTLSTPLYEISRYAAQNGMTVNDFYIGRIPDEMRQHAYMMPLEDVLTDTAYVFYDSDRILCGQYPFYYNLADGLIVGTVDPVEGGDNLRGNDSLFQEYSQSFTNQQYLTNGSDVDGRRYIYQRGVSYGPHISLKQGQYVVTITGENLTSADLFCYAGYGSEPFNLENTQTADSEVSYIVTFDHDVKDIEFVVQNNRSERAIVLDSVRVARMLS